MVAASFCSFSCLALSDCSVACSVRWRGANSARMDSCTALPWGDSSTRRCGLTTAILGSAHAGSTASAAAAPINPTVNLLLIERFTDNYLPLHVIDFGPRGAG